VRSFIYATYPKSLSEPLDSLFCLAPSWVFQAIIVTVDAGSSYLAFSPLPYLVLKRIKAVYFLWHYPSYFVTKICPYFHRELCPVVSGLSSCESKRTPADQNRQLKKEQKLQLNSPEYHEHIG